MAKEIIFSPSKKQTEFFRNLEVKSSNFLILMAGSYQKAEKTFLNEFEKYSGLSLTEYDMNDLIFEDEKKSVRRIDSFFDSLPSGTHALLFRNADRLNGAYTGHTNSSNRYATPQEKYFLKKLHRSETILFLDFEEKANLDPTIRRHAHLIVDFSNAAGILDWIMHSLRKFHVHGSRFDTKRRPAHGA